MANFFDVNSGKGITSLNVKRGAKFRIGLYGGGPDGERLNVTTTDSDNKNVAAAPDPAVTFLTEQKTWHLIYEVDSTKLRSNRVRACWNGSDYSASVVLNLVSVSGFGKTEIRQSIVELARSFVPTAHYLWGTAGNTPGMPDGNAGGGKVSAAQMRTYSLSKTEAAQRDKVLGVCMAVQPQFDGYNTCAGRSSKFGETLNLDEFLKSCQQQVDKMQLDQTKWPGAGMSKKLFPRRYHFRSKLAGTMVWGESCAGVRHFDCVGLVNYCYGKHWYKGDFGLDISAFRNPAQGTVAITNANDLMDADILLKADNSHIGMLYRNGQEWCVVQAESTEKGLTDTAKFDAKAWDRFRMQDAFLKARS